MSRSTRIRARYFDPAGDRYGIPTYWWQGAPDGLATRRQLRAAGLRPGGQDPVAQVMWHGIGGDRVAYLYSIAAAKPKRTASPAQLIAIGKAIAARRTCPECGHVRGYCIPTSLGACLDCIDGPVGAQHDPEVS